MIKTKSFIQTLSPKPFEVDSSDADAVYITIDIPPDEKITRNRSGSKFRRPPVNVGGIDSKGAPVASKCWYLVPIIAAVSVVTIVGTTAVALASEDSTAWKVQNTAVPIAWAGLSLPLVGTALRTGLAYKQYSAHTAWMAFKDSFTKVLRPAAIISNTVVTLGTLALGGYVYDLCTME